MKFTSNPTLLIDHPRKKCLNCCTLMQSIQLQHVSLHFIRDHPDHAEKLTVEKPLLPLVLSLPHQLLVNLLYSHSQCHRAML